LDLTVKVEGIWFDQLYQRVDRFLRVIYEFRIKMYHYPIAEWLQIGQIAFVRIHLSTHLE